MSSEKQTAGDSYAGVWGHRIGFGKTPALLMIDFAQAYTQRDSPLFAEMVEHKVERASALLEAARRYDVPVIHTRVAYKAPRFLDAGVWMKKSPVLQCFADPVFGDFCDAVRPSEDELVITKQYASGFFGTSLFSTLHALGVDTVIVTGCSTSGCVRATAVDGVQHGFRVIVPEDCVGDRHEEPHRSNLFDINAKYGDVVNSDEVKQYFAARIN